MAGRVPDGMKPASSVPEPPSVSDEALAARLIAGDQAAFDELVLRWRDRVVDLARLLTGDGNAAEDVGQDVFMRFLRRPAAYDPARPFGAWICTVARNMSHDRYRREFARTRHTKIAVDERRYGPRPLTAPLDGASESEAHIHLRNEIALLPPNFKDAYVLCSVRGLSYDEAGAICGCPAKTISTRLARARKQLVKRMEKWL